MSKLMGYPRPDGRVGIRNHVLVIPTVVCANTIVEALDREFGEKIRIVTHPYGCTFDSVSNQETTETIAGFAANPNVAAALIIGLGCETVNIRDVYEHVSKHNPNVEYLEIQKSGGTRKTIALAKQIVSKMLKDVESIPRVEIKFSDIIVGTECGSSDSYSGLSANPAIGNMADRVVAEGGSVLLTELTEFIGAEDIVYQQCSNPELASQLRSYLIETEGNLAKVGSNELRDIAPGNIAGGLSTLEEKSLGCIKKGGTTPIRQILSHGQIPTEKGLLVMDASGHDIESVVAMAAGGAQVFFFSTGRGSPTGSPIAPVIKVTSNTKIFNAMRDNMDINTGTIIDGEESIENAGQRLFEMLIDVINGAQTKSEENLCREFAIRRRGVGVCIL